MNEINSKAKTKKTNEKLDTTIHQALKRRDSINESVFNNVKDINILDGNLEEGAYLHTAIKTGYVEHVKLLLDRGAENKKNHKGETPLELAWKLFDKLAADCLDIKEMLERYNILQLLEKKFNNVYSEKLKRIEKQFKMQDFFKLSGRVLNFVGGSELEVALIAKIHLLFERDFLTESWLIKTNVTGIKAVDDIVVCYTKGGDEHVMLVQSKKSDVNKITLDTVVRGQDQNDKTLNKFEKAFNVHVQFDGFKSNKKSIISNNMEHLIYTTAKLCTEFKNSTKDFKFEKINHMLASREDNCFQLNENNNLNISGEAELIKEFAAAFKVLYEQPNHKEIFKEVQAIFANQDSSLETCETEYLAQQAFLIAYTCWSNAKNMYLGTFFNMNNTVTKRLNAIQTAGLNREMQNNPGTDKLNGIQTAGHSRKRSSEPVMSNNSPKRSRLAESKQ